MKQLGFKPGASVSGSEPIQLEHHPLEDSKIAGHKQTSRIISWILEGSKANLNTTQNILCKLDDQVVKICTDADFIRIRNTY